MFRHHVVERFLYLTSSCELRPAGSAQLLVDVPDAELRTWAEEQSVFVSSVMTGLRAEREAAAAAIEALGATPIWFEAFGGMDDPEDSYLSRVARPTST